MNRREFLRVVGVGATLSLPVLQGCDQRQKGQATTGPASRQTVWKLGPRDAFSDGVNADYAAKNRGAVFVVRRNKRIYAISSICTHLGCVLDLATDGFACGCHGSRFALDGTRLSGPAKRPLVRYGISVNGSNEIIVDKSLTFSPRQTDDLRSFVFIY